MSITPHRQDARSKLSRRRREASGSVASTHPGHALAGRAENGALPEDGPAGRPLPRTARAALAGAPGVLHPVGHPVVRAAG